jgi:uncharacterized membrane protein
MNVIFRVLTFMGIQMVLGRKFSFPYGVVSQFKIHTVIMLIFICDIVMAIVLLYYLDVLSEKFVFFRKIKSLPSKKKKSQSKFKLFEKLRKFSGFGLFVVSANPYVGGCFWGCLFAHTIGIKRIPALVIVIIGSLICTLFYVLTWKGIQLIF